MFLLMLCSQGIQGSPGLPGLIGREGPKVSASVCKQRWLFSAVTSSATVCD